VIDAEEVIKNEEESGTPAPPSVAGAGGEETIESGDIAGFEPVSFLNFPSLV